MFTDIIWLIITFMTITLVIVCFKLFKCVRLFHVSEHKKAVVSFLLMIVINTVTIIESIFLFTRFSDYVDMGNIDFSLLAFISFICAFCTFLPDLYPATENRNDSASFSRLFYNIFFSTAVFFEIAAIIFFYLGWIHA